MVEEILVPGASVAMVARAHGVNTNQIYHWRKLYERGLLGPAKRMSKLVPVTITEAADAQPVTDEKDEQGPRDRCCSRTERGTIHVTFKDVHMCVEGRVDESSLRILLRAFAAMISPPAGTRIWIAAGITDMRRGFTGLSAQIQTALEQNPFEGHVFVFAGAARRSDQGSLVRRRRALSFFKTSGARAFCLAPGGCRHCLADAGTIVDDAGRD